MNMVLQPRILALPGRDPSDAIIHATLVPNLRVSGVSPSRVDVLHDSPSTGEVGGVFRSVTGMRGDSRLIRQARLILATRAALRNCDYAAIYARDVVAVFQARVAMRLARRKVSLLFDCRGDIVAEAEMRRVRAVRLMVLRFLQRSAIKRADRTMTVSDGMARSIATIRRNNRVAVVPNLQERTLPLAKSKTPLPSVVFAGGGQAWQDSGTVLRSLRELSRRGVSVEVISRDSNLLRQAASHGLNVSSGDRTHVLDRLRTATASWMVRQEALANAVASPVKLGEALSAGAMIIGSRSTWERIEDLEGEGLAIVVDPEMIDFDDLVARLVAAHANESVERPLRLERVQERWTLQSKRNQLVDFFLGHTNQGLGSA